MNLETHERGQMKVIKLGQCYNYRVCVISKSGSHRTKIIASTKLINILCRVHLAWFDLWIVSNYDNSGGSFVFWLYINSETAM